MPHKYIATNQFDSLIFPGVKVILKRMTEGRRLELRKSTGPFHKRIRDIMREQAALEAVPQESRDMARWLDLQDEFDEIVVTKINPTWIQWGVKNIEGLEVDGRALGVDDYLDWPSALYNEVVEAVKAEAELDGRARKNSSSPITSGAREDSGRNLSIVEPAKSADGGATETARSSSLVE